MKGYQKKNQLLIVCLVVGFFIGIVYENIVADKKLIMADLFLKSNLELYLQTRVVTKKYVLYVLKERLLLFAGISVLGCMKWKKLFAVILVVSMGFLMGIVAVASVLELGIVGIVFCIAGVIPQGLFYGMIGYMMLNYWYRYPNQTWNRAKTIFVLVMFAMGVLTESYVNPVILKWIVKAIC